MNAISINIFSIIIMIAVGYTLKRIDFLSANDGDILNKIVMYVLMPCMIFNAVYNAELSQFSQLCVLPCIIMFSSLIIGVISYLILKRLHYDDKKIWSILVCLVIANTAFMGYPINLGIFGQEGLLRAIFCDVSTLCMFLVLSFVLILKFGGTLKSAVVKTLLFPSLWSVILGLIFNFLNIPIGSVLDNTISYLGQGAIPLIMITLGLSIDFSALKRSKSMIVFTSAMKLMIFPAITFLIAKMLGIVDLQFKVLIIESAMPSGMLALLLAITYDLDYELTSDCIFINTVISLITLPIIISFV